MGVARTTLQRHNENASKQTKTTNNTLHRINNQTMAKSKRRSEGVKQESDSKRQKTTDKELSSFIESTLDVVSSMPNVLNFHKLPSKKFLPDYYDVITAPISLHEIKAKSSSYTSTDEFLADFQLMADNANTYNLEESDIAKDSIIILNFVRDQIDQYSPPKEATPEPQSEDEDEYVEDAAPTPKATTKTGLKIKIKPPTASTPMTPAQPSTPTPGTPGTTPASGMTQKARFLMVLEELMNYEVDGINIGKPFTNDVSRREFPDYYKVIKKPMTLGNVKENILAGRVKSMGQFQNQVELVWKNAQLYNDVGTLLHSDSRVLQDYFHTRMAEINREIEAARMAQLQERSTPSGSSGIRLKIKPPKTKLSLTFHNRDGGLQIPGDGYLNPLTGEEQRPDDDDSNSSGEEDEDLDGQEDDEATHEAEPTIVLSSTKPRQISKPASELFIQEVFITSSRSLYKQLLRPTQPSPIQPMQNWFEHRILASDYPVTSYTIPLHRQQGAVSVSAGLNDTLINKKHHAFLTVNGERVSPVPSIHYADSGRQLTSRYELKLPLGLNMVVFDVAVEDTAEESRTRAQEAANMKTEKLTFWIQVL